MNKKLLTLTLLTATTIFSTGALAQADYSSTPTEHSYSNEGTSDTAMERPHSHPMMPAGDPAVQPNPQDLASEPNNANLAPAAGGDDSSVPVVTGGVGEEMDQLKSIQNQYSLKLLITEQNGTFLSNVDVKIKDKQGNIVVETTTQGPVLLAKLPKGTYTVVATREDGETKQLKASTSGKLHAYQVAFDDTETRASGDPKTTPLE